MIVESCSAAVEHDARRFEPNELVGVAIDEDLWNSKIVESAPGFTQLGARLVPTR
jgi:hypothetical protein